MNIEKLFKFIKDKRGYDYPFSYKLIKNIPLSDDELNIGGDLDLLYSDIVSLPDNLKVGRHLDLRATNITSLPDNLSVGRDCNLSHLNINSIPNNFNVYGDLFLCGNPITRKYTYREIRKMIEDKGGSVHGVIFI